ncbi:protein kinase [Streptomyces sp. B6B3]|uniref:protein kinase domain-containing protein n=1 Tax=Streptomyces sp. B6B3 TaxID=3153570 RepID=UPI00325E1C33
MQMAALPPQDAVPAEPRDAAPAGPVDADLAEPGTMQMAALPPQDAAPAEPRDAAPAEPVDADSPEPGTMQMAALPPQDAPPAEPADTAPAESQVAPPGEPEDAEPVSSRTMGELRAADFTPVDPPPAVVGPPEPLTMQITALRDEDHDDEDRSLGGDAPLVGVSVAAGLPADDEDQSLGGDAPLIELPAESSSEPSHWEPVQTGRVIAGRYRLGDPVGRGGMGTVWRAQDEVLGRAVAVKELRLPTGVDDGERERLVTRTLREAKAIATIRNTGVVTVYDVVDEGSRPWIVMELIEGRSLADIIRDDGPMEPHRVAEIGLAVLDVLRAAHGAGILHRDVKPSNVLVAHEDGRVVLTDFGIAKVEGDPSITSTGMLVGAPSYISPERARGELLGPPADLWSLGALLYCCVEGRPPYDEGGAIATLAAVMHDPVPPPRQAEELTEVITGLLAKEPEQRLDEPGTRELLLAAVRPAVAEGELSASGDRIDSTMVVAPRRTPVPGPLPPSVSPPSVSPDPEARDEAAAASASSTPVAEFPAAPAATPTTPPATPPTTPPTPPPAVGSGLSAAGAYPAPATPPTGFGPPIVPADPATPPPPPPANRRRVLLIAGAVVLLIALLGAALAVTLGGGDESPGRDDGESGEPSTGGDDTADPSEDPTDDPTDEPTPDPTDDETTDPDEGDTGGAPGATPENDPDASIPDDPSGFSQQIDPEARFSMSLPSEWERDDASPAGSGVYSAPGGGPASVGVDFDSTPGESALSALRLMEPSVSGDNNDYELVSVAPVEWRDYPAVADWEYEHTVDGERVRVLNRAFRVDDDHGYTISVSCPAEDWDGAGCTALRDTAFDSFEPLD